jgi:hypothetical protein
MRLFAVGLLSIAYMTTGIFAVAYMSLPVAAIGCGFLSAMLIPKEELV